MARNLMHDHTVSEARQRVFEQFIPSPCTGRELRRAIVEYFYKRVFTSPTPDFLDPNLNERNWALGIDPECPLFRLLDVTSFVMLFQWAHYAGRKPFDSFPVMAYLTVQSWLDEQLAGGSESKEQFVKAFLDALNAYPGDTRPVRVTTWDAFAPFLGQGPDRWFEVWGVPKWSFPRWLIVLRYKASEAGTLVRPTQLDMGWNPYYFPPPPQASVDAGGYAMALRSSPYSTRLLPMFIHRQIDHSMEHWTAADRLCDRVIRVEPDLDLAAARHAHRQLLAEEYGSDVYAWMPECS
ncbi:MAG: hypothetical protein HY238_12575 [Acidobacteria bacterium]|nr:hypothetical protein [Acidobacteriota bacterium]